MRRPRPFKAIARAVRNFFARDLPDSPPPAPSPQRGPISGGPWIERESDLPPGWSFEGLWFADREGGGRMVRAPDPSDSEIASANAIIVSYTDALGKDYRTIHGAGSRKQIGDLISKVTMIVSPPR